jgi:D-lactate dehydrogenase (cytochrome)
MPRDPDSVLDACIALLGAENVVTDADECALLGNDLFFWDDVVPPRAVLRPKTAAEVAAVLTRLSGGDVPVYLRGGGMSYTNAYGPSRAGSLLLDLRRLDAVRLVDPVNRVIVVEAGCTWAQVVKALAPHGMQVDFPAPLSGSHSTVGGALSQNVPGGMQGVLGLEAVLADGRIVRTGAWSAAGCDLPFYRNYGPDLTGLFLGDSGIFGVKTAVALHIKHRAAGAAYGSFAFDSYESMAAAMIALAPYDFIVRRTGLDPYETANIAKVGMGDAIRAVMAVAQNEGTAFAGLKEAARMAAAGRSFLDGVAWSLHLKVESVSNRAAEEGLETARAVCLRHGREIPAILPRARDAVGFSIRKFLGKDGERWVATSSLWPISRAVEVASAIQAFFAARRAELDRLGIAHSYITNFSPYYFLCEPCFYWRDSLSELHLRQLAPDEAERFRRVPPNIEARAAARRIRAEMRDLFQGMGSLHVQIGAFYRFADLLRPETLSLLKDVKLALDPENRLNPGKLDGIAAS